MLRAVTLVAALLSQPLDAGARVGITFELRTPDAVVHLVHGKDVREIAIFPVRVRFDPSQRWTVTATKPGYCPLRRDVDYTKPTFVIELRPGCSP